MPEEVHHQQPQRVDYRAIEFPSLDLALELKNGNALAPFQAPFPETVLYPPQSEGLSWHWMLLALGSCAAAGGVAVGAFLWLVNLPPKVDCSTVTPASTDRAQLYCMQAAAEIGDTQAILEGLEHLRQWDDHHPLHHEVLPLVESWSRTALNEAHKQLRQNNLDSAIALTNRIPEFSPLYPIAQAQIDEWTQEWRQGDVIWQTAQEALQQKDWETASNQIHPLSELQSSYWHLQAEALSQQLIEEKRAQRLLAQAKAQAAGGGVEALSGAIRAASQIDANTYTAQEAQPFLDRWSDWLLEVGLQKWYDTDLEQTLALGHRVALNSNRAQRAQELIWLAQARQLARQSIGHWQPQPRQAVGLYRAMLLANQIPADSWLYPQAQSSITSWRGYLKDLLQLQVAQTLGQFRNREALRLAIAAASAVPPDHPRRLQAQTLAAHWQNQIERVEDRPYLTRAHELAQPEDIASLQEAIAMARHIPLGRALRQESQNWIYRWQRQIEILEDQPQLDEAKALAANGQFDKAIAIAIAIQSERALYEEAQAAIKTWRAHIRARELARQRARAEAARRAAELSETLDLNAPPPEVRFESPRPEMLSGPQWSMPRLIRQSPPHSLPAPIETAPRGTPVGAPVGNPAGPESSRAKPAEEVSPHTPIASPPGAPSKPVPFPVLVDPAPPLAPAPRPRPIELPPLEKPENNAVTGLLPSRDGLDAVFQLA